MNKSVKGSVQLMLTIFIIGLSVILFTDYRKILSNSFAVNIASVAAAVIISMAYFMPSIVMRIKTNFHLIEMIRKLPIELKYFSSVFYSIYFIWIISYVLIVYSDLFFYTANPNAYKPAVVFIILAVCTYAACRGYNGITRCAVFIFAFSLITFAVIYLGNIFKLDFEANGLVCNFNNGTPYTIFYQFLQLGFLAVLFGILSDKVGDFNIKHILFVFIAIFVIAAISIFYINFELGSYSSSQKYDFYLLSKASETIWSGGTESFYLALCAMVIFLLISISLLSMSRVACNSEKSYITISFGVIAFVLYICAESFDFVRKAITSAAIFNILTFVAAVILPVIYIYTFGRKSND